MAFIIFPIHFCLQILNLALWALLIVFFGLIKWLFPLQFITLPLSRLLTWFMSAFGHISVGLIHLFNNAEWDYQVDGNLNKDSWYLVYANHLSYLDIILMIEFAAKRIPSPKFFLKQELIWLPFVGVAAWALEMPFMKRYSREFVAKHPHLKGKDIETTRKHCEKYKKVPTTVINFVEGTRFTEHKHAQKKSTYKHLLPPKAGGIAFTFATMGELFTNVLDVTIQYPQNNGAVLMDMLAGRLKKVVFHVELLPVSQEFIGDYFNDPLFKDSFQAHLNQQWQLKDQKIAAIREASEHGKSVT
ncbi:MAG: acyltransferase [Aestuariibacter sp.]